jgi:ATP-dependent protease HslVU (ClpYQ) peptidase subunit
VTVICWDGKTLAADKAGTNAGYARTVTKIYRVPGGLVGFAGDGSRAMDLLEWFRAGRDPLKAPAYPEFQKTDDAVGCIFIADDGKSYSYLHSPYPELRQDKFDAIGSGRDYALAAMYLGHDARKAVEVACALDNSCGKGIDTLELNPATGEPQSLTT